MRRYENMPRHQIYEAINQYRKMLAALEKYQAYLVSGGIPRDELSRSELQSSNSRLEQKLREYLQELDAELKYRDDHGIN